MLMLSSAGCYWKHVLMLSERTSLPFMLSQRCYHEARSFRCRRPCFMIQHGGRLASPHAPPPSNPLNTLRHFLKQELGLSNIDRLMIVRCGYVWSDICAYKATLKGSALPLPSPLPSVMFTLNNEKGGEVLLQQYNVKRGSLFARGIFLLNMNLSREINGIHRVVSDLLPQLELKGRTVQFLETGVYVDGRLYGQKSEFLDQFLPHRLYVEVFPCNVDTKGDSHDLSKFVFPPSPYVLKTICSRLGLPDPRKLFSGLYCAVAKPSTRMEGSYIAYVQLEDELDKRRIIDAFRELVQSDSYDGILRVIDLSQVHHVTAVHGLACSYAQCLRKMEMTVKLTDCGVLVNDVLFRNCEDFTAQLFRNMITVSGIPEPLSDHSDARNRELVHTWAWGGLKLSRDNPLDLSYVGRLIYRDLLNHRIMLVVLANDKEKERILQAYSVHRWPLMRKGMAIRDLLIPVHTWRIHLMAMILLGGASSGIGVADDVEAARIALRDSCVFTDTGVILNGESFDSIDALECHICACCSKTAEELIPSSWTPYNAKLMSYLRSAKDI